MNALALWIPGAVLIVAGALLLALQRIDLVSALTLIGIGVALETLGLLLWLKQRGPRRSP
jgi:hypothetical protein